MLERIENSLTEYRSLIANIDNMIQGLNTSKSELEKANSITTYFSIDNDRPDNGKISDSVSEINSIITEFNGMKSEINSAITRLESERDAELTHLKLEQEGYYS